MTHAYDLIKVAFEVTARPLTRRELAKVIGRAGWTLQANDLAALSKLMAEDVIEGQKVKVAGRNAARWEYKRK